MWDAGQALVADLTAVQQLDAVAKQVLAAGRGMPLSNVGAEMHPPDMLRRPTNNLGAEIRVAYWLGVAARPTGGRASDPVLLTAARTAAVQAKRTYGALSGTDPVAMLLAVPGVLLNPFGTDSGRVNSVLYAGEQTAARRGRADIAAILNGLRAAPPTEATGVAALLDPRDEHTGARIAWLGGGAATVVLGLGVLYFAWPAVVGAVRSGAPKAARAAGSAYAGYRERKQARA